MYLFIVIYYSSRVDDDHENAKKLSHLSSKLLEIFEKDFSSKEVQAKIADNLIEIYHLVKGQNPDDA